MENNVSAYNLFNIIEAAVLRAKSNMEYQYIDYIKSYFNEDNSPKMINMNINSKIISVPKICLSNLKPISIKSVNINFDCCLEGVENDNLMVSLLKDDAKNKININITLDSETASEGIMRINDMLISDYYV